MIYVAELYYLQDQRDFPFQKAVLVTAQTVAQWCAHYRAKLIAPAKTVQGPAEKQGLLPIQPLERALLVEQIVQWIFANSLTDDLFYLLLDDQPISAPNGAAKFDHPDDTCCWFLNLNEDEFDALQAAWRENGLPANLFYPKDKAVCVPFPGSSLKAKMLRALGAQKCYTPMQWQAETASLDPPSP